MTQATPQINLDELRQDLTVEAQRSASANRPRHILIGAGALFVVALIAIGLAYTRYAEASSKLESEKTLAKNMVEAAARLRALKEAAAADTGPAPNAPDTQIFSRIEQAGHDAGLTNKVPLPQQSRGSSTAGASQKRYLYELRDASLPAILLWVERCQQEVPGLEVSAIIVRPEAQVWYVKVTFSRWERTESGG